MNSKELLKLAQENPEVAKALIEISKVANNTVSTNFDESVPAAGGQPQQAQGVAQPQGQPQVVEAPQGAVDAQQQAMQMAGQQQQMPEDAGARAAQSFLAPVFAAAAQGDAASQQILALAAGEVARGATSAVSGQGPVASPVVPEQMVADQVIAAPTQAKADATPAAGEGEGDAADTKEDKGEKKPPFEKKSSAMFSAETVRGIVELVRAGIV